MGSLDWIPIICATIGRNAPGRRYVGNRLPTLRRSLDEWVAAQDAYRHAIQSQNPSLAVRRKLDVFTILVTKEIALLNIAVSKIELWCRGGRDSSLNQAQQAYAQSQLLWKRRMALVRDSIP